MTERHGSYTANSLSKRIDTAVPGEWIVYHVGDIQRDLGNHIQFTEFEHERIRGTIRKAMQLWKEGLVHLVQKRVARGFEYIAIRRDLAADA